MRPELFRQSECRRPYCAVLDGSSELDSTVILAHKLCVWESRSTSTVDPGIRERRHLCPRLWNRYVNGFDLYVGLFLKIKRVTGKRVISALQRPVNSVQKRLVVELAE
jgi:hypothetical protein